MFPLFRKYRLRQFFTWLCVLSFAFSIWTGATPGHQRSIQASDAQTLFEAGVGQYQQGDFPGAIATWQQALDHIQADNLPHQTIVLENLARAHRQIGQFSQEIAYWEQAIQQHQQLDDLQAWGRALIEAAQAYNRLGQHRRALALLCGETINSCNSGSALHLARAMTDANGEVAALGSLGETYRLTGDYDRALTVLEQSLAMVGSDSPIYQAAILTSLGNTYSSLAQVSRRRAQSAAERDDSNDADRLSQQADQQTQQAITFLQGSYDAAQRGNMAAAQVRSQLNLIPLYRQANQLAAANQSWQTAQQLVATLPATQEKAFAMLTLAGYLESQTTRECPTETVVSQQKQLLEDAIAIAKTIQSSRAESFAWGQLGNLYERCGDYAQALSLTQKARLVADQNRNAQDSLYLWAWQQGRILNAQGKSAAAKVAYTQALETLEAIRSDILNANRDLQFDFRDRVEPIYREFADLRLAEVPASVVIEKNEKSVDDVLTTLDSLRLAELQNYFANDCVLVPGQTSVDTVGEQSATAVINTAIWEDRTAVIARFPNGQQQVEWIELDEQVLIEEINQFRIALESGRFLTRRNHYRVPAQTLYNQLIQPFVETLDQLQINSLVFINDGLLRSIPMAALYDGNQFLIEKYALATTPNLNLINPKALDRTSLNALILGLSEESKVGSSVFYALGKVKEEIATVKAQFSDSKVLQNEDFSETNLREALKNNRYNILHIATHGVFGATPEENYIVTGQKLRDKTNKAITISELDSLIRSVSSIEQDPIDLLTLTACETAIGDNRATLGLAGVAVRAGVRSAIASLWSVDDAATAQLITRFYHYLLDPNLSKAQALRAAQLEVIQSDGVAQHPYYWAPFILIGNWL